MSKTVPWMFIDEMIEVAFDSTQLLEKKPECPNAFIWRGEIFNIEEVLEEWVDNTRRGRMARNMSDEPSRRAAMLGSWGVGRYYYRVRANNRYFELYYDRSPGSVEDRKGHWFLLGERRVIDTSSKS